MENNKIIDKLRGLREEVVELKDKCVSEKNRLCALVACLFTIMSLTGCKTEDDIYFSTDIPTAIYMQTHDEENCIAQNYANSEIENERTFEEWNQQYITARSSSIRDFDGIERASTSENDYAMREALYNMGLIVSEAQIAEALGIDYEYIDKMEINIEEENVTIEYRAFENKTSTGGIDTGMHTNNRKTYELSGEILDVVEVISDAKNNTLSEDGDLSNYDEAYRELNEFWLYKGTVQEGNIFSGEKLYFELDHSKVEQFNQENNPEYQLKLN